MSTLSNIIFKGTDAFDEGDGEQVLVKDGAKGNYVHIRIQQRNGRKSLTTVQGLATDLDLKKILKALKKTYSTNGTILVDEELGEIIQLQGDQRKNVYEFLTKCNILGKNDVKSAPWSSLPAAPSTAAPLSASAPSSSAVHRRSPIAASYRAPAPLPHPAVYSAMTSTLHGSSLPNSLTAHGRTHMHQQEPQPLPLTPAAAAAADEQHAIDFPASANGHNGIAQDNAQDNVAEDAALLPSEQPRARRLSESRREPKSVRFLCFDLSSLSGPVIFALLSAGVIGFFILNSFLEEYLFKALKDFKFGWYMTAFELMCFTGFAVLERYARGAEPIWSHVAKYRHHLLVAFCMTCSRGLTNKSLEYLNYPTQVIFKSMKLITVMVGSIFILHQRFTIWEYASALALVLSAILFSLGDVAETPELGSTIGFVVVLLSLVADAMHSNTQEQLLKGYKASVTEAMMYTNGFAALMAWVVVLVTGEFGPASAFCAAFPLAYILFVMRAAVIYLGVLCFVLMINTSGVVAATAVTTVRKILTIVVSFILFPKPISSKHVIGFLVFSLGVIIAFWDQKRQVRAKEAAAAAAAALERQQGEVAMGNLGGGGGEQRV